jgi:hypothetical protein
MSYGQTIFFYLSQWILPLITATVSITYFLASSKTQKIGQRLLASSHGILLSAIYLLAFLIGRFRLDPGIIAPIYLLSFVFPACALIYSFIKFSGNRWWHSLQIVNGIAGFCIYSAGFIVSTNLVI